MKKAHLSGCAFFTIYREVILEKLDFLESIPTCAYFFTADLGPFR